MKHKDYFDVLIISDDPESADMIQALMINECLGTFFQNGSAKLYFHSGLREQMDIKLKELLQNQNIQWGWETQASEDWHLSWQDHFKPVVIDNKLAVIPHWENDYPVEFTIKIKPGMAFGTGHHESTWLMLRQMLKYLQPGMSVLDLGTGSGILSIAAKKLGAGNVDSVELDPECETNFYENLELNGIKEEIQFHNGDVLNWHQLNYDLILANLNQTVFQELIPNFKGIKSIIIMSGILGSDYNEISEICSTNRLTISKQVLRGEWICIIINPQ